MKWQSIIKELCYSTIAARKNLSPRQDYTQTLLLNTPPLNLSDHTLYFCNLSDYRGFSNHPRLCAYILYQDIPEKEIAYTYPEDNLLVFQNRDDFLMAYQTISTKIAELEDMKRSVSELFILSSNNAPLQVIANRIDEIFHVCVSILDNSFSVLTFSDNTVMLSPKILTDIRTNSIPLDTQRWLHSPDLAAPHSKQTAPTYFDQDLEDGYCVRNYLTLIYMNNLKLASFSLLYTYPTGEEPPSLSPDVLELLPVVASALSIKISKEDFYTQNKASYYTHLFSRFLSAPKLQSPQEFQQRLSIFGYNMKTYKYIVLIDYAQSSITSSPSLKALTDQVHKILSNNIYVINEHTVIYLCSHDDITSPVQEELEVLRNVLIPTSVCAGVSSIFTSLTDILEHIQEAQAALTTGSYLNNRQHLFLFDDLRIEDLARSCFQHSNWKRYCYPPYMRILEYDEAHNTKLADTLLLYLSKGKKISEICDDLFIHKNTLYYRLDKIRDIMEEDFENPRVITQIQMTCAFLNCQERLSSGE